MTWFTVSKSCDECGPKVSLVGPFKDEETAEQFLDANGGMDPIYQGSCGSNFVVELTALENVKRRD